MFKAIESKKTNENDLTTEEEGPGTKGHIRCLGVVPIEIEDLLKEIQLEIDSE